MWHIFMRQALDAMGIGDGSYSQPTSLVVHMCEGATASYMPGTHC